MALKRGQSVVSWVLQLVVAVILLQTLFFKFTGAAEPIYIFKTLGMEPWGRIGSGVVELIASVFLLVPSMIPVGAILALGTVTGALAAHLTKLGIVVQDDGGTLFIMALVVFFSSLLILFMRRKQIPFLGHRF